MPLITPGAFPGRVNFMLEFLLSMIKFKKSSKTAEYQPSDVMVASLSLEREEDGFVMVGETEDERNTVKPGDAKNKESPPSYDVSLFPSFLKIHNIIVVS